MTDYPHEALEQVGLQLVSSLAQTATVTISQGLPMLMGSMVAPMGVAGAQGPKQGKRNVSSQLNVAIVDTNDPAYLAANHISASITLLATILGAGSSTGVDWEHLDSTPVAGGTAPKNGLTYICSTLTHTLESTQWTDGSASQELKDVLTKLATVVEAIKTETAQDQQLTAQKAKADSPLVKEWQHTALDGKVKVAKLITTANSLPGSAPGGVSHHLTSMNWYHGKF